MNNLFSPLITIYKALYLFAYDITGNYGISLVLLSLFTFIVLYPFTKKAQHIQNKEHRIQSVLGPQIESIKKHYSGREQYEQLQWLYRRYSYHPLYAIRSALGFVFQIPFLTTAYYMLSGLSEIQDVSWGIIPNLGAPDHLLNGINILPFVMTLVTVVYAFVMPGISKKERMQTVGIGVFFLVLLYAAPSALLIFWTCNLIWSLLDSLLSEKLAWIGEYIAENELAFHIIFALAVTVGLLIPTEIYIKNASQLWFKLQDIGIFFLLDTVKYICVLFILYVICWNKKVKYNYLSILSGLLLGVFLQSYIIGTDYGMFDGHKIQWGKYTLTGIINTIIWISCLGVSICVFFKTKFNIRKLKRVIKPIVFFLVIAQCITLLLTLKNNQIKNVDFLEDGKTGILTTRNMYTISDKDNIIVFLLDGFAAEVFEEIQQKDAEAIDGFKDFIYYPDIISSYGYTYYSLPEILTGILYNPQQNYSDYLHSAWLKTPYYRILKENNFAIDLYTSGRYVDKRAPIRNLDIETIKLNSNTVEYFRALAWFRIVPHYLKVLYYQYQPDTLNTAVQNANCKPYKENDREFFLGLKKHFQIKKGQNCFKFYHLSGMHEPYTLNEDAELVGPDKSNYYKQAMGSLAIVKKYIAIMKQYNIYDSATIVILADHGTHNTIGSRPIFFIKPKNRSSIKLSIDQTPITVADLLPMIFWHNQDFKDKTNIQLKHDKRFFYYEDLKNKVFLRYEVQGPANNRQSWKEMSRVQKAQVMNRDYIIGQIIDLSFDGNSQKYKGFGWREKEDWEGTLIAEKEAELLLNLTNTSDIKNGLILKVVGSAYLGGLKSRKVKVFLNDSFVGECAFDNKITDINHTKNVFSIPKALVSRHKPMRLRFLIEDSDRFVQGKASEIAVMIEKCQFLKN